jgi:2,5-diamino-6-(ribosylamino)-4(3H)-pyrimidinone 5'-phosphate reductase
VLSSCSPAFTSTTTTTTTATNYHHDMSDLGPLPPALPDLLGDYLPLKKRTGSSSIPFVTLTYAQSLDARIAAAPGTRTSISHAETKTMTHYIRSFHDAILVGVNTVLADNPRLDCRYSDTDTDNNSTHKKISPLIVDPRFRLRHTLSITANSNKESTESKLVSNYLNGTGAKPTIILSSAIAEEIGDNEDAFYCDFLRVEPDNSGQLPWDGILRAISSKGHQSVMIEGGASIINTLLNTDFVDSLIVTIGPVYLGDKGVAVAPAGAASGFKDIKWWTGIQDAVMCAHPSKL